jgi:hypothetical protein
MSGSESKPKLEANSMTESTNHDNFITIVSGLPRSGTSMMMRMLEAGGMPALTDEIRKADFDNPNGYYEFEPVKQLRNQASWIANAYGKAVKMVYALLYELPRNHAYKVILMKRNLEEVIASQDAMLRRQGKDTGTLGEAEMAQFFRDHLERLQVWLNGQENFASLSVDYNNFVKDPAATVVEIDRFLGNGLDTTAMTKFLDPTLYRQRRYSRD